MFILFIHVYTIHFPVQFMFFSLLDDELILRGMLQPPGLRCRNTHEVQPQLVASSTAWETNKHVETAGNMGEFLNIFTLKVAKVG